MFPYEVKDILRNIEESTKALSDIIDSGEIKASATVEGVASETTLTDIKTATEETFEILERADESITRSLRSINSDHGAIHLGMGFCLHLYHPLLANQAKKTYRYKAPTTKYAHLKSIQVNCAGATVRVRLVKDVTITVSGDEITDIQNLNHNSTNLPESKVFDGDLVEYTGGVTWCEIVIHGDTVGTGQEANRSKSSGSFIQSDYLEYVTKSDGEEYIIEIENIDTKDVDALDVSIDMFFYEEDQGIVNNGGGL